MRGGRVTASGRKKDRGAERLADRERQHAAEESEPRNGGGHHDRAGDGANRDAEIESSLETDRIGERAGQQGENRHGGRPAPSHQRARRLVAEAEVLREPQDHRLVRDRVGHVDEELEEERQPKLATRAAEDGEFADESGETAGRGGADVLIRIDRAIFCRLRHELHC